MANILIVDDAVDIIQVLSFILKKQGHTVTSAIDGADALSKAKQMIDVPIAFVDFNLPDMTGAQLTVELKKQFQSIKVILLSGQEGVDPVAIGVDAFVPKPFTSELIKKTLENF